MSYLQAIVLGIVQGLTEFLPVSSSGHLILVPHVFGWADQGQAFDAVMHIGTMAALVAYFRRELWEIATGKLSRRLTLILIAATIPAGLTGVLFGKAIEAMRSPLLIAGTLVFWGLVMWLADRSAPPAKDSADDPLEGIGWRKGLTVGIAQAIALIPGTSRSGITITAGLLSGLDRATAARFSFLLGIPITAAAGLYKLLQLMKTGIPSSDQGPLMAAMLASFLSGWVAVAFLVGYLRRRSLTPFVIYRIALALLIVLLLR
ncbi:MAG TPA: undecaprenyl-diphosphatase UppP [Terriglobales bacterium]|nr:undecaprenyl-diphosphatase UppP [Terriglobales bacterium]